ncbi:hypothetical protein OH76DRAFT_1102400 [Lentinus brumalis]|uniref:Uncharacterized protein n=1 Tax=Lentinus brumalis TaxID=2498619 RepID=A0A371CVK7_9APHY|nr:hypothetical protein OH76DRAFT_1102400 [Polyporus brumalis]
MLLLVLYGFFPWCGWILWRPFPPASRRNSVRLACTTSLMLASSQTYARSACRHGETASRLRVSDLLWDTTHLLHRGHSSRTCDGGTTRDMPAARGIHTQLSARHRRCSDRILMG